MDDFSDLTVPLRKKGNFYLRVGWLVGMKNLEEVERLILWAKLNIAFAFFSQSPVLLIISH